MAKTRFHGQLEVAVQEEIRKTEIDLAHGSASSDIAIYRYSVGYIAGLEAALRIADKIEGKPDS